MKHQVKPNDFASTWMNRRVRKNGTVYFVPPVSTSPVKVFTEEEKKALQEQMRQSAKK